MLDDIFMKYKIFDDNEQKAVYFSYVFFKYVKKVLPDYNGIRFSFKSNPVDSVLFKYCYKMIEENKNRLSYQEMKLFMIAQIDVIRQFDCPFPEPSCLIGEKAWNRWLVWKKKYEHKLIFKTADEVGVNVADFNFVKNILDKNKVTLERKLGEVTRQKIQELANNGVIYRWISSGLISGWILKLYNINNNPKYDLDLSIYKPTKEITEYFKTEFH